MKVFKNFFFMFTVCAIVFGLASCKDPVHTHTFDDGVVTTEATEDSEGVRTFTCTGCGETKTEAIPKLEHTHKFETDWTSDDSHHWHKATCAHTDEVDGKAEHSWDSGTTSESETTYKCEVCGKTKVEAAEKESGDKADSEGGTAGKDKNDGNDKTDTPDANKPAGEIKPAPVTSKTFTVDLTPYLGTGLMKKVRSPGDYYEYIFNITEAFPQFPKKGDVIEYTIEGTFSNDIGEMEIVFVDNSEVANWWLELNRTDYDDLNINADVPVTIKNRIVVDNNVVEKVSIVFQYKESVLNDEVIFVPKGDRTPVIHKVDLTPYLTAEISGRDDYWKLYAYGWIVTDAFGSSMPKKGDIIDFTVEGSFLESIPNLDIQFKRTSDWSEIVNYSGTSVKPIANELFSLNEKYVCMNDAEENIQFLFLYSENALNKSTAFVPKGWTGDVPKAPEPEVYLMDLDLTPYLKAAKFNRDVVEFDFKELGLIDKMPQMYDMVHIKFDAKVNKDMSLNYYFYDGSEEGGWSAISANGRNVTPKSARANEFFTFDGEYMFTNKSEPYTLIFRIWYDSEYSDEELIIIPKGCTEDDLWGSVHDLWFGRGNYYSWTEEYNGKQYTREMVLNEPMDVFQLISQRAYIGKFKVISATVDDVEVNCCIGESWSCATYKDNILFFSGGSGCFAMDTSTSKVGSKVAITLESERIDDEEGEICGNWFGISDDAFYFNRYGTGSYIFKNNGRIKNKTFSYVLKNDDSLVITYNDNSTIEGNLSDHKLIVDGLTFAKK